MLRWYLAAAITDAILTADTGGAQQKYAECQAHHEGVGRVQELSELCKQNQQSHGLLKTCLCIHATTRQLSQEARAASNLYNTSFREQHSHETG